MRRLWPMVVLLAGCAPAAQAPLPPGPAASPRIERTTGGYNVRVGSDERTVEATFPVAPARLWPIALRAYTELGLRADSTDPAAHSVRTRGMVAYGRMAGRRLSDFFDCGADLGGAIADSWRVRIDAWMAVSPAGSADSASLATVMAATATPVGGADSDVTPCSSRGRLEAMLVDAVRKALGTRKLP